MRKILKFVEITFVLAIVISALSLIGCKEPADPPAPTLTSITAVYSGTAIIYPTTPLKNLKVGLTVNAVYSDSTTQIVTDYSLSGTLTVGSSVVSVSYEGKTTTFNVTVTAVSSSDTTYTVTFNSNDGTEVSPITNVTHGSTISSPPDPTKAHNTFGSWYKEPELINKWNFANDTVTEGTILYAKWILNQYTVSFNANGGDGTVPNSQTVNAGSSITLPSGDGLTKNNFNFGGWNINDSGTGTNYSAGSSYPVSGDIILYAKWNAVSISTVTVRFETNGGSSVGNAVILQYNAVSRPSTNPSLIGYTFNNWYANPELTEVYNFSSIVITDIVKYAKWNPITYTVTYNKNASAATGTMVTSNHTYDVDQNLNLNSFSRKNYSFAGWATTQTGEVEFTDGEEVKNLRATAGTVTLYAQWNYVQHTITTSSEWTQALSDVRSGGNGTVIAPKSYIFNIDNILENIVVSGQTSINASTGFGTVTNIIVTLNGSGTLSFSSGGIYIGTDQRLIIDSENLTLKGRDSNTVALLNVVDSGNLELNRGTISGNSRGYNSYGNGVYVGSNACFIMSGGKINGNTTILSGNVPINGNYSFYGGGVYVAGSFIMYGGEISDNTSVCAENGSSYGGGVYVDGTGSFTMYGGEIKDNRSFRYYDRGSPNGGGVAVGSGGTFRIITGNIYGNTATNGAQLWGTAQIGTFSGETWNSSRNLTTTNDTIRVVNGELQP